MLMGTVKPDGFDSIQLALPAHADPHEVFQLHLRQTENNEAVHLPELGYPPLCSHVPVHVKPPSKIRPRRSTRKGILELINFPVKSVENSPKCGSDIMNQKYNKRPVIKASNSAVMMEKIQFRMPIEETLRIQQAGQS